jgi:hypothetical protein
MGCNSQLIRQDNGGDTKKVRGDRMREYGKVCPTCGSGNIIGLNDFPDITPSGWKQKTYYCEECPAYFDVRFPEGYNKGEKIGRNEKIEMDDVPDDVVKTIIDNWIIYSIHDDEARKPELECLEGYIKHRFHKSHDEWR